MPVKKQKGRKIKNAGQPRASVTFPPDLYHTLQELAQRKKVSIAWVVREAAERYVTDQLPLLAKNEGQQP
jgi:hypothetical protein